MRDVVDWRTLIELRRLAAAPQATRSQSPTPVKVRPLGDRVVLVRSASADAEVLAATFVGQYHLPPSSVRPRLIWDLGANIGLTMAHMAHVFADAQIVGVEPDPDNASLARRNMQGWSQQCRLIEAAVWTSDGAVRLATSPGREAGSKVDDEGHVSVTAVALSTLLELTGPPDFVKMDIEGAEAAVLRKNTDWAARVSCISVECHAPYSVEECAEDLRKLDFGVTMLPQSRERAAHDTAVGLRA